MVLRDSLTPIFDRDHNVMYQKCLYTISYEDGTSTVTISPTLFNSYLNATA
jgi:hypothetical protein